MDIRTRTKLGTIKILMLKGEKGEKGADGSAGDYSLLDNKPRINGTQLDGNMTSDDLSLASATQLADLESDVSTLQTDVSEHTTDISGLQSDVSGLQTDVSENTTDISNLKEGKLLLDTSAQAGTTDGDLYAAIVALGWDSDVIE